MTAKGCKYIPLWIISVMLLLTSSICAQKTLRLTTPDDALIVDRKFQDSTQVKPFLDSILQASYLSGNLVASFDRVEQVGDSIHVTYFEGPRFTFGKLQFDPSDFLVASIIGEDIKDLEGKALQQKRITALFEKMITESENVGYPFASIRLDSIDLSTDTLNANVFLDRGQLITMDSLVLGGTLKIHPSFLRNYLNIKKGAPFDRSKIKEITKKLRNLSFVNLKEEPQITFVNNQASINLLMNKKKSSHFDFLIGLLQNQTANGQQYIITGSFTAEMINKLSYGERIYLQYQRLRPETQELDIAFDYPYILGSAFGTSFDFNLYRNATTFLDANLKFGGQYYLQGRDHLKVSWNYKTSRLLDIDTLFLQNQKRLPSNLDISYTSVGVGFNINRLDYIFNPRKGFEIIVDGNVGSKKIIPNATIASYATEEVDFSNAYDSLDLNTYQFGLKLDASYYQPLSKNITIKSRARTGWIYNEKKVFENELLRIGGNKLLRGFDEQSVRSSFYTVLTAEMRFILAQQNNNFTLALPFIDVGFEYNPYREDGEQWDQPIGVGVGMDFETAAGIFSFAVAAGKRLGNPLDFGNLKIHFGYVNLF